MWLWGWHGWDVRGLRCAAVFAGERGQQEGAPSPCAMRSATPADPRHFRTPTPAPAAERVVTNLSQYGNTSAASIPLALDEAVRRGDIKPGEVLAMAGFGAGLSWASAIVRWG